MSSAARNPGADATGTAAGGRCPPPSAPPGIFGHSEGRAFAVVGPSGAGKDTLLAAALAVRPGLLLARRIITRPAEAGGEDFEGVTEAAFAARRGEFALVWAAHGLHYAIPASLRAAQRAGQAVVFNGSRGMLAEAARVFAPLSVIVIEARPEVLAARLAARGREDAADIAARLARADLSLPDLPQGVAVHRIDNSGALAPAVTALLAVLDQNPLPDQPPVSGTRVMR